MQYNTQRDKLCMPEYGRVIHDMVRHAMSISDKEKRQRCAQSIIEVMANKQPELRKQDDFRKKLWDHLAYLSGYQLDVDYPYPVTRLDAETSRPTPLSYPAKQIRNRHYGYLTELFLDQLEKMEPGNERTALLSLMANQMKQSLFDWNRDAMDAGKIASDIARYTHGSVNLDISEFKFRNVVQSSQPHPGKKKKKK